jgi:hypothetical protein
MSLIPAANASENPLIDVDVLELVHAIVRKAISKLIIDQIEY